MLACTELQLLIKKDKGIKIFDTMKILSDKTTKEILE
jgi:aspartate/glutamate racemase